MGHPVVRPTTGLSKAGEQAHAQLRRAQGAVQPIKTAVNVCSIAVRGWADLRICDSCKAELSRLAFTQAHVAPAAATGGKVRHCMEGARSWRALPWPIEHCKHAHEAAQHSRGEVGFGVVRARQCSAHRLTLPVIAGSSSKAAPSGGYRYRLEPKQPCITGILIQLVRIAINAHSRSLSVAIMRPLSNCFCGLWSMTLGHGGLMPLTLQMHGNHLMITSAASC